jgi:uncharacterized protein
MMYVIKGTDRENSLPARLATRAAHLERLHELKRAGRLLLAGPLPAIDSDDPGAAGYTGSLIVAEFSSRADAEHWAQADPYMTAGVYASVTVEPFRRVLP